MGKHIPVFMGSQWNRPFVEPIWAWICGVHFWAGFSARQRLSQGITTSMDVVILCGGQGARMREETEYRPKPMVEVGGRRQVWHLGNSDFGVNTYAYGHGSRWDPASYS
jgi:hypothetical protein